MSTAATSLLAAAGRALQWRWRGAFAAGWPVLIGLTALVASLLMLGAAAFSYRQAERLAHSLSGGISDRRSPAVEPGTAEPVDNLAAQLPSFTTHLWDIEVLFALAKDHGVVLGPITYRSEASPSMPVLTRLLEVRLDEEYPKIKKFVAELLKRMPHLYLEEIRVDQGGASASKLQATLKISFVYQGTPARNDEKRN
jgi:hypothetical protein